MRDQRPETQWKNRKKLWTDKRLYNDPQAWEMHLDLLMEKCK